MNLSTTHERFPCPSCDADAPANATSCERCGEPFLVFGRFELSGVLGSGGMGTVFGVHDVMTGSHHAMKIQHLAGAEGFKNQELLERSSAVLEHLDHPGLPKIHASGALQSGRFAIVRDAFDGGTLAERLRHTPLTEARIQGLLEAMLGVLDYLQSHIPPVVHRDVKPANIMFREPDDWSPVLVDFDTVAGLGGRAGMTMVGTPGYMAPELLAGDSSPASDLYSLGATMMHVITRVEADVMLREDGGLRFDTERRLSDINPVLRRVIEKLVEPDRRQRYTRASEALEDLRRPASSLPARTAPRSGEGDASLVRSQQQGAQPARSQVAPVKKLDISGAILLLPVLIFGVGAIAILNGGFVILFALMFVGVLGFIIRAFISTSKARKKIESEARRRLRDRDRDRGRDRGR